MSKVFLDEKIRVLRSASSGPISIIELSKDIHTSDSSRTRVIKELRDQGLLNIAEAPKSRKGRPKVMISTTELGREMVRRYDKLMATPLKSRKSDLLRAAKEAAYAKRLASRGVSPYGIFFELSSIARDSGKVVR